jgi:phosphomannomutase
MTDELRARARAWADNDPDPETVREIEALLAAPDPSKTDLADRFAMSLEFGTAGLRGVLGAGPNRMNRAVVLRTTFGLARHLQATIPGAAERGVVIGFDGRRGSRVFAEDAACVLAACGIRAHLFDAFAPTPLTAFAVKHLGAAAGVMVTASHNPPEYNGYKAYWDNGAQIVPPIDVGIAKAIEDAPAAKDVPRLLLVDARARGLVTAVSPEVEAAYLAAVRGLSVTPSGDKSLRIVYTAMHGVGNHLARAALAQAGFAHVASEPSQADPDGGFPTVAFPNPEEKGAMDRSFALARAMKADLVLANDPDADRLAVAVPSPSAPAGYVQFTGNQVGVLLGHHLIARGPQKPGRLAIASIVSSPMLGRICADLGVRYEETLTGFKWIANRAMELEAKEGLSFVFGYEEALGYTVGPLVRDKDGVSAVVAFAELAAFLRAQGKTLLDELDGLYRKYGLFVSSQVNVTRKGADGVAQLKAMMAALRESLPAEVAGRKVLRALDYASGTLPLPKSDVLTFELEGGSRIIARPSGTEPKAKFYFDVREEVRGAEPMAEAEARAHATRAALEADFSKIAGV